MMSFDYLEIASRLISGKDALAVLPGAVAALGARRLLLLTGQRTARSRLAGTVREALSDSIADVYAEVGQHPGIDMMRRIADVCRSRRVDGFLCVGGGSVVDTAKAVNVILNEERDILDIASRFTPPDTFVQHELNSPKFPIVSLPTTLSGAELTPGFAARDADGTKLLFWDVKLVSRLVVHAPECVSEVPGAVLAASAMNGFAHCVEGLYSRRRNPFSDGLALHGIRLFSTGLNGLAADPGDTGSRETLLTASALGGKVIANARVGIHHAICHCLGSRLGVSHGLANAIVLPHAMRFNLEAASEQLAAVGIAMGANAGASVEDQAHAAIESVSALLRRLALPARLRDVGVSLADLPRVAEDVMKDRGLYFNPRRASDSRPVIEILKESW